MGSWEYPLTLSPDFFSLLRYCLVLVLLIHLPYMGMLIGGSAISLLLNLLGRDKEEGVYLRLSKELIQTVTVRKSMLFLFGFFPIFPVALIYIRIFQGSGLLRWYYWVFLFMSLLSGFLLLLLYRATFRFKKDYPKLTILSGLMGHLTLVFAYTLFFLGTGIIFHPEKLPFLQNSIVFALSWNAVVKIILFFILCTGITGAAMLLFIGASQDKEDSPDEEYRSLARKTGSILSCLALPALPLFVLFNLITLPDVALSGGVFFFSVATIFFALAAVLVLFLLPAQSYRRSCALLFSIYVMIFFGVLMGDTSAVGNAYEGRMAVSEREAKVEEGAGREAPAGEPAEEVSSKEEAGKAVYERVCSGCHRFDSRVVGPPLNDVLPKYGDDEEMLKNFIRNPVKVNPDYPPMPKLGLKEEEIYAVATYLLEKT